MDTLIFILAGLLILFYVITMTAMVHYCSKTKKEIRKQKKLLDSKIESCRKVITHEVEFVKQLFDIIVLSENNPDFLHKKISKLFYTDKSFETELIQDSIAMANICKNDLISHFATLNPQLSKNDLEFCSLICLGFPSHTMQKLYNIGNSTSYYNRRKRLRTKLNIESSLNLDTFIKEKIESLQKKHETE